MTSLSLDEKNIEMRMRQMGKSDLTFKDILNEWRKANGMTEEEFIDAILNAFINPPAVKLPSLPQRQFQQSKH